MTRLIWVSFSSMIVLVISSLPSSAADEVKYCKSDKDCGSGHHCQLGINPEAGGICVANTWCWPKQQIDCPPGFRCSGINPNEPSPCIK